MAGNPYGEDPQLTYYDERSSGNQLRGLIALILLGLVAFAILSPAAYTSRAPSQRAQCANNLRQLSMATVDFYSEKNFSPASYYESGINTERYNWVTALMPRIGQQGLYDSIRSSTDSTGDPSTLGQLSNAKNQYVAVLVCPIADKGRNGPYLSYAANMGRIDTANPNPGFLPGIPKANGNIGTLDTKGTGIFYDRSARSSRSIRVAYQDVRDGGSTTILMAEMKNCGKWTSTHINPNRDGTPYELDDFHKEIFAPSKIGLFWYDWQPQFSTDRIDLQYIDFERRYAKPVIHSDDGISRVTLTLAELSRLQGIPSSDHHKGFFAAFCDGTVKYMSNEMRYNIYCQLMTPNSELLKQGSMGYGYD